MALKRNRYLALLLVIAVILAGVSFTFYKLKSQRQEAENKLGLDSARVISATFQKTRDLRVATLTGDIVASGSDARWYGMFPAKMTVKYPYSVGYFVDLKRINSSSYRWNQAAKTMIVELPDVQPDMPNVDASKANYVGTEGWFVGGDSAKKMIRAAASAAASQAELRSKRSDHLDDARESAREVIQTLVGSPLRSANLGQINVVVRFPWERSASGAAVRWDESTPIDTILGRKDAAK